VLEVSYSQDGKDLRKLASDYILGSNGDIKAVIGIDINYGKASTVSLWRPNYIKEAGQEFDILEVKQELSYQVCQYPCVQRAPLSYTAFPKCEQVGGEP
jgi:hypothetical protein